MHVNFERGLYRESVDRQETNDGSSIDQLCDAIWDVYRKYAQQ